MRTIIAALLILVIAALRADDAALRQQIVGTWKLVSVVYEDAQTKERTPVLGEHPKGSQIATPEGRWLALERARALTSMIAYTGR